MTDKEKLMMIVNGDYNIECGDLFVGDEDCKDGYIGDMYDFAEFIRNTIPKLYS